MPRGYPNPPKPPKPSPHPQKVGFVVEQCVALLRGLPSKRDRTIALGQILATLNHSEHIDGIMNVVNEAMNATNHYRAPIETRSY